MAVAVVVVVAVGVAVGVVVGVVVVVAVVVLVGIGVGVVVRVAVVVAVGVAVGLIKADADETSGGELCQAVGGNVSTYTTYDFSASLARERAVEPSNIEKVLASWGNVNRDGACCDACGGEWTGGFLMQLKDSRFAYLSGWCDYTGWGCQDGTHLKLFDAQPSLNDLESFPADKWDLEPIDLNKWLKEDGKLPEV